MRAQLPEDILVTLLRQCYLASGCRPAIERRPVHLHHRVRSLGTLTRQGQRHGTGSEPDGNVARNSGSGIDRDGFVLAQSSHSSPTTPESTHPSSNAFPQNIAVLGGGITGLASAYYLSKELPNASITLYEASDKMGGWLQSKHVDVGNGKVIFEQGPRTLRPGTPAGMVTLDLIKKLGLEDKMLITARDSVAAKSRFIYYPDHLVQMPGPGQGNFQCLWRLLTEPIFEGLLTGAGFERGKPRRSDDLEDESVGSFLQRRLGTSHIGDNLVSAMLHGIYAGDIYQLSIKSLQPLAWYTERQYGNLFTGFKRAVFDGLRDMQHQDAVLLFDLLQRPSDLAGGQKVRGASVYSFEQGIGALSDALVTALKTNSKVHLKTSEMVKEISFDGESNSVKLSTTRNQPAKNYNQVISTISGRTLSYLAGKSSNLPSLSSIHAVTVMVVNLYYANPSVLPAHGFGYLIPRSVPWDQNPERALGVVFDSDAIVGQDTAPGTKVTVMLGGHWWDDWSSYPDEGEGAAMAKAILKRHLKIEEEPVIVNVGLHRECIPQYTVGHEERMKKAHQELMREYKGKLAVAGNSYTGVGLNDCVRAAKDLVKSITYQGLSGVTGLERFTTETKWVITSIPALFSRRPKSMD